MNRFIVVLGVGLGLLAPPSAAQGFGLTYYVDAVAGDDLRSPAVAQSAATPWRTIGRGIFYADGGDAVVVNPGTYVEAIESKRDGWSATVPIVLRSAVLHGAVVQPPAGLNGIFVSHNYLTIDGFRFTGAFQGLKLGPHDGGGGPVVGLVIQNNVIDANTNNGLKVGNGLDVEIAFNTVANNGANGISYAGSRSLIHDNVVHDNDQFGIYVRGGVGHRVYDNVAFANGTGDDDNVKVQGGTLPPPPQTYYVDCGPRGDDTRAPTDAKNPATPWKTIGKGVLHAQPGDTVAVAAGVCAESVESKRDGAAGAPIVIVSTVAGGAIVRPPAGANGFFISHDYHTVDGFAVEGAVQGIKLGPHDGGSGPVRGLVVRNSRVSNSSSNGIIVTNGADIEIAFNTVENSGANGISYSGNAGLIHDNVVHDNHQFGIYVQNGVDHQVYDNTAFDNGTRPAHDIKILGATRARPPQTYYVDCDDGADSHTITEAKSPDTPWRTIRNALITAEGGDTVMVLPGLCDEPSIESRRDGVPGAPITIRAQSPGTVTIQPPSGNGVLIAHSYHTLSGLVVTGATGNGIQVGPHDVGGGAVKNVIVDQCWVHDNAVTGVKFSKAVKGRVRHSVVRDNGGHGISYAGKAGTIFNNLVYANGCAGPGCGDYGISILAVTGLSNAKHRIANNTIYGNFKGGLRLGDDAGASVSGTAVNNVVVGNPVGIKEQGLGSFALDYNDVFGNAQDDYQLSASAPGVHSISVYPEFVAPAASDFRLSRVAAGQAVNSPCIDAGSSTAADAGLADRTVFTDGAPDTGVVDLGYHGTAP